MISSMPMPFLVLKYIAYHVSIKYEVLGNYRENAHNHAVTLFNNGERPIPTVGLYFIVLNT